MNPICIPELRTSSNERIAHVGVRIRPFTQSSFSSSAAPPSPRPRTHSPARTAMPGKQPREGEAPLTRAQSVIAAEILRREFDPAVNTQMAPDRKAVLLTQLPSRRPVSFCLPSVWQTRVAEHQWTPRPAVDLAQFHGKPLRSPVRELVAFDERGRRAPINGRAPLGRLWSFAPGVVAEGEAVRQIGRAEGSLWPPIEEQRKPRALLGVWLRCGEHAVEEVAAEHEELVRVWKRDGHARR
eukprot:COSAG04_NODE_4050_length_2346_cov_1.443502_3_plen_240_part_00